MNLSDGGRTDYPAIEIPLKMRDDFASRYDNNNDNTLKAVQLIKRLSSGEAYAYFQKQKIDTRNRSTHRMIVPFEKERAFEFGVTLWTDQLDAFTSAYSYLVSKCKEIPYFRPPQKNTVRKLCLFKFVDSDKKAGSVAADFKELYKAVEAMPIPAVDVNKEKDQQIWTNYVVALKKLVKQKEHVWKIRRVSEPYFEVNEGDGTRAAYIDILINEKDMVAQLQEDILGLFKDEDLEDYMVNDKKAFIEFKNYREQISAAESTKLREISEKLFYQVSTGSPVHYIEGEIGFRFLDESFKQQVVDRLNELLLSGYQLPDAISSDGTIDLQPEHIPHLQKLVTENFDGVLSLNRGNSLEVKVFFQHEGEELEDLTINIKSKLDQEGLTRGIVYTSPHRENLVVEISTYIPPNKFQEDNLNFVKSVSRFAPETKTDLKPLEGMEIANGAYQLTNASLADITKAQDLLKKNFPTTVFLRKATLYLFTHFSNENLNKRRDFKTKTDLKGKSEFIIPLALVKITPVDEADYQQQLKRIQALYPDAIIEKKPYSVSWSLQFKTDLLPYRQKIMTQIQDELSSQIQGQTHFDAIKNFNRLLFSYTFQIEEQREIFKTALGSICEPLSDTVSLSFESETGRTRYELLKNETLVIEKENELISDIKQATFVYITPEQRTQLEEAIEKFGDEARFRNGTLIGTLVRKDKDKLKFRITTDFEIALNAKESERIDRGTMSEGYIKPIFPGELTNIDRMIRAMRKVTSPGPFTGNPVNRNLPNFIFDPAEARDSTLQPEEVRNAVITNLNEPLLANQPKQLEAVTKALAAADLALIQGPPGTGKTTVIAEIIWQALSRDPDSRILITSQTNLAVDNALERLAGKKRVRPVRIGNIDKFENEGKVYSSDRIKKWLNARDEGEEAPHADNAIREWIENVKEKCSGEEKFSVAVGKWKAGLDRHDTELKNIFGKCYFRYVNVLAATCSECGSRHFGETYQDMFQNSAEKPAEPEFDIVIMDEASKATPPELVLPLTLGRKVIIIGDHKQLPPMMDEQEFSEALETVGSKALIQHWTRDDYKVSQFEKLFKNAPKNLVASLDTQFRMHEQIMNCISQFYTDQPELENGLICGIRDQMNIPDLKVKASRWHGLRYPPFIDTGIHAIWVNVESPEHRVGTSFENEGELEAIYLVLALLKRCTGFEEYNSSFSRDEEKEIGIITYYMPQMNRIKNLLYPSLSKQDWRRFENLKLENKFQIPFRINTVDRFQGMERNIVIISTVRSHQQIREENGRKIITGNNRYPQALGFAKELQRVNVGFSRAKRLLIVVGNQGHFSQKAEYAEAAANMHKIDIAQLRNLAAE